MATGGFGRSRETSAYTKLVLRLMICATKVLRRFLKDNVAQYGQSIDSFLLARKHLVLNSFIGKMNTTVLFPLNSRPTDIDSWDICLIVHVLLVACTNINQKIITALTDLRQIRNEVLHSAGARIKRKKFNDYWTKIGDILSEVLKEINDQAFENEICHDGNDIEKGSFEQDFQESQKIINQWYQLDLYMMEKLEEVKSSK